jgi:hypothetical protein
MALPTIPIPFMYIVAVPTAFILIIILLLYFLLEIRRYAPESFVIRKARKNDKPMLILEEIGTGLSEIILGKRIEKGSPLFELPEDRGVVVDPAFLHSTKPANWGKGLMVYHYATSQYQPMTTVNALGINTCLRHARKNYPEFAWMRDRDLMAFAKMRRDDLGKNLSVILDRYKPQWNDGTYVTADDLKDLMVQYQDDLRQLRTESDVPLAWDAAFSANPVTHTIKDLQEMQSIFEQLAELKFMKKEKLMMFAIAALIIMVGAGVAVFLAGR